MLPKQPKIAVIGAGIAGLTLAYRLHQKKHDVHVYEARARVGGRVLTATLNGSSIELGGQNIADGGSAENIRALVHELGLDLETHEVNLECRYFDGVRMHPLRFKQEDPETLRERLDHIAHQSRSMREVLNHLFDPEDPMNKALAVRLAGYEGATVDQLSPPYAIDTLYHMLLGGISTVHQKNAMQFTSVRGGNVLLLEKMAEALGDRVHLNMPLVRIDPHQLHFVREVVPYDVLVLAIPCSTYAAIACAEEVLSAERWHAIQRVQYGENSKIIIPMKKPSCTVVNETISSFFNNDLFTLFYTGASSRFSAETIDTALAHAKPMMHAAFGNVPARAIYAQDEAHCSYDGPVGYSWPNDPYARGSYSCIGVGQAHSFTSLETVCGETVKTLFAPTKHLYFAGEHTSILMDITGTMEAACESGERTARMIRSLASLALFGKG